MVGEVMALGALGSGVPVMLAGAVGLLVARWGRGGQEVQSQAPSRPRLGLVTTEALADLPLVAPGRAGYGTATHLLIEAARGRRAETGNQPTTMPARGTRAA